MQFTACGCGESNYRLLPRRWWMRFFVAHRHYRCSSCHAHMLLKQGSVAIKRPFLLAVVLGIAVWATFYVVGYLEESRYASERRNAENQ